MTSPSQVAEFHAQYEGRIGDRGPLFGALAAAFPTATTVLYPGSYVDIAPSIWFDDVTYVDLDRRAARFFGQGEAVVDLVVQRRRAAAADDRRTPRVSFQHQDYRTELPLPDGAFDLLVSLYAGFISEHCTRHLRLGGTLLVNPSHGDAAMASIDPRYRLDAVVTSRGAGYRISSDDLDTYLVPRKPQAITAETLHRSGRGIAYTRAAFAYVFTRVA